MYGTARDPTCREHAPLNTGFVLMFFCGCPVKMPHLQHGGLFSLGSRPDAIGQHASESVVDLEVEVKHF